jgi:hypothetical protein
MESISDTRWFWIRLGLALGVIALLGLELAGHRAWFVVLPQALLVVGIVVTSALDFRDLRRRTAAARPPPE